jgi:hypothetical protein
MKPEEKARQQIDVLLQQCGWLIQDYKRVDLSAGTGIAVREVPMKEGKADYLLLDRSHVKNQRSHALARCFSLEFLANGPFCLVFPIPRFQRLIIALPLRPIRSAVWANPLKSCSKLSVSRL